MLTPDQIDRAARFGTTEELPAGAVLFGRGDGWPPDRLPHLLEASRPGVFVVGGVRADSAERVAAAVGEGLIAAQFVHRVLDELRSRDG